MSINGIANYQISANALYAGQSANTVQSTGDVDRSRAFKKPVQHDGRV